MDEDEVDQVIDALYVPPPAGFTAARDAAAARLKAAGAAAEAKRVAGLRRPTLAAWASNMLVRAKPEEVEQFLQLGQALREAHRALDGQQLRDLSHEQHVVIGALAREAARLAEEAGATVSEAVVRGVGDILHAVLADPRAAEEWASGRLAKAPEAVTEFPGVDPEAVARTREARPAPEAEPAPGSAPAAAAAPAPEPPAGPGRPDGRLEAAREAVRDAERAAAEREEELRLADDARRRALTGAADADAEADRREAEADRARTARDQAYAAVEEAEARHREAARAARDARRAAQTAGRRLRALEQAATNSK